MLPRLSLALLLVSTTIFALCLIPVITGRSRLTVSAVPLAGALATVLIGISAQQTVLDVLLIVWNPTLTLVAMIIFSLVLDQAGFFRYIAIRLGIRSGGSLISLFLILVSLTALISAIFANDGAVLIMTPITVAFLREIRATRKVSVAFLISVGFISDTGSIPFLISNLVNILTAGYFGIDFLEYAARLLLPGVSASLLSIVVLYIFFRRELKGSFPVDSLGPPESAIKDSLIVRSGIPATAVMIFAYALTSSFGFPIAIVALPFSLVFLVVAILRKNIAAGRVLRSAPWHIVLLSLGLYVILFGMADEGLSSYLLELLTIGSGNSVLQSVFVSGFIFALLASAMNNMPSVMLGDLTLRGSGKSFLLVPVNIISNDVGPKMTPIGSLATLLWFHRIDQEGMQPITYREYMRMGIPLTVPVLMGTLFVYWLTVML